MQMRDVERDALQGLLPSSPDEFDRSVVSQGATRAMARIHGIRRRIEQLPQRVRGMGTVAPRGNGP